MKKFNSKNIYEAFEELLKDFRKEFNNILNTEISKILPEVEVKRKNILLLYFLFLIFLIIALSILVFAVFIGADYESQQVCMIVLPILMIPVFGFTPYLFNYFYKKVVKKELADRLVEAFSGVCNLKRVTKNKDSIITKDELQRARQMALPVTTQGIDDVYSGNYKNVSFSILETDHYYGLGKTAVHFDGIVVKIKGKIQLPKMIISRKPTFGKFLGDRMFAYFGIIVGVVCLFFLIFDTSYQNDIPIIIFNCIKPFALILIAAFLLYKTPDGNIANKSGALNYKVASYSESEICPLASDDTFFNLLETIKHLFKANGITCVFGDSIIIFIETGKDVFEIGSLFKSVYDIKSYKTFFNEISSFLIFIEYLKNIESLKEFFEG